MKVCVVTGTRAEYGLLYWVLKGIKNSKVLELQLLVTGMHLSPEFGMTVDVIEKDGFKIDKKVEMLLSSDTPVGVAKSTGLATISIADALNDLSPDLLLLLGDRFELLAASTAALIARIPIAHLHGGETTEGAFDEAIRHSITKMSHLHFVAAEAYRRRVIQLGEQPESVFNVGGLGIDNIINLELLNRQELEKELNFKFLNRNLLITFHPVTLEEGTSKCQMNEILSALSEFSNFGLIFTMPNSDTDGRILFELIEGFCASHQNAVHFTSLGQIRYLSCLKQIDAVVGNSSSGLLEVPSFGIPTVNIGERQKGRLKAGSVIDCEPSQESISEALRTAFSEEFQIALSSVANPYDQGGASTKIIKIIEGINLNGLIKKKFYDLKSYEKFS